MNLPKVISLYSFKGGAGRTVITANLVGLLAHEIKASKENPILLLDMDLDSAGLTMMLDQTDAFEGKPWNLSNILNGTFSFRDTQSLADLKEQGVQDVSKVVGAPPGSVLFIGAEPIGHEVSEARRGIMDDQMMELLEYCAQLHISTLVIDSASGLQQIANLTRRFANVIVYCARLTRQFLWGSSRELEIFVTDCKKEGAEVPNIVLVPSAVPKVSEQWKESFVGAMTKLRTLQMDLQEDTTAYLLEEGVCEVESFKWGESVLTTDSRELSADEKSALRSFRELTTQVNKLANSST